MSPRAAPPPRCRGPQGAGSRSHQRASAQYGPARRARRPGRQQRGRDRLRPQHRPLLGRAECWMQFCPDWANYGVDANGAVIADPERPRRCDLRAARTSPPARDARRQLTARSRLQPRRLVRLRGPRRSRLLRHRSRRSRLPPGGPDAADRKSCGATRPPLAEEITGRIPGKLPRTPPPTTTRQAGRRAMASDIPARVGNLGGG